jgi:hypothetical protein
LQAEYEIPDAIYDMIQSYPEGRRADARAPHAGVGARAARRGRGARATPSATGIEQREASSAAVCVAEDADADRELRPSPVGQGVRPSEQVDCDIATNFLWMLNGEKPNRCDGEGP